MGVYLGVGKTVDDYSAMQGPCPDGFHVPTSSEWSAVRTAGINMGAWTSSGSASITNIKNYLKIPLPGSRSSDSGSYDGMGNSFGEYWTCTRASHGDTALRLFIRNDSSFKEIFAPSITVKSQGIPIRPFKDEPVIPDSSWTVLYQGTGTSGIYRNSTLGLISISSDGTTRYTIADKNLGATTVYSNGASLSEANCGKFYQRGNNYGFPYSGSITTSSTQVNAQNYGPGNYYSSSTFIYRTTSPYSWDSSYNNDLRGGETGVQPKTVYPELKNAYIGEVYEYSYDFRNKSSTDLSNDGWVVSSGTLETGSNGITSPIGRDVTVTKTAPNLSTARKIIIGATVLWNRDDSGKRSISYGLINTNITRQNYTSFGLNTGYDTTYVVVNQSGTVTKGNSIGNIGTSTYTPIQEIDLVNKTLKGTVTGLGTSTLTLTDSQIATIKSLTKLWLYTTQHCFYIQDYSLTIEY